MAVSVTLRTPEVIREAKQLPRIFRGIVAEGTDAWLIEDAFRRAKQRNFGFTDRTGRLRASIAVERTRDTGTRVGRALTAGTDYAAYVEEGNRGRYSYLGRAVRETEGRLRTRIDRAFDRFDRSRPGRYRARRGRI